MFYLYFLLIICGYCFVFSFSSSILSNTAKISASSYTLSSNNLSYYLVPNTLKDQWSINRFLRTFPYCECKSEPESIYSRLHNHHFSSYNIRNPVQLLFGYNSSQKHENIDKKQDKKLNLKLDTSHRLTDWDKIQKKLNLATSSNNTNPINNNLDSSFKNDKKEDERESNSILSHLTNFFIINPIDEDKKIKQSIKSNPKQENKTLNESFLHPKDKFFNNNATQILVCDKTLAIISFKSNQTIKKSIRHIDNCELFDLEKRRTEAENKVKKLNLTKVEVDFTTMMDLMNECKDFKIDNNKTINQDKKMNLSNSSNSITSINKDLNNNLDNLNLSNQTEKQNLSHYNKFNIRNGIVTGTLWCGMGDSAKNYYELGPMEKTDACCRSHDHCPVRLKAFTVDYNLFNFGISTKSHCRCDREFFDCLKKIDDNLSRTIGKMYFNLFKVQCLDRESVCVKYQNQDNKVCLQKQSKMKIKNQDKAF